MKKLFVIFFTLIFVVCACSQTTNAFELKISQLRYDVLTAENQDYLATCYLELRESPFCLDGISNANQNVVIVKLKLKNHTDGAYSIRITTDKTFEQACVFDAVYCCFVASFYNVEVPNDNFCLEVVSENNVQTLSLQSVKQADTITYQKAVSSCEKQAKQTLAELGDNYEICVRLIHENNELFYFVGFSTAEQTLAYLLDATSGKIIANKIIEHKK